MFINFFLFKKKLKIFRHIFFFFFGLDSGLFPVAELDLELRERLRLVVLGLIVAKSYPQRMQKSLDHIFEPLICWQGGSALKKMSKFWIFLKLPRLLAFGLTFATVVRLKV